MKKLKYKHIIKTCNHMIITIKSNMAYYIMKDEIKIKLYSGNENIYYNGHLYQSYGTIINKKMVSSTGKLVMLMNDNSIVVEEIYKDNIYKKQSRYYGLKTEYKHVSSTDIFDISKIDIMPF